MLKEFFTTYLHHQWSVNFARCPVLSQEQKYPINKKDDLRNYRQYIICFDGTCYWDYSLCIFTINMALNGKNAWRICEDVLCWDRSFMESDAGDINCKRRSHSVCATRVAFVDCFQPLRQTLDAGYLDPF